ncbi:MAG TPA: ABC-2 family transporter protein [Chthonomonadaceae bacterium]|nr:ABC-2 family transporter protein [Chthonomonadaceae bacterium]
MRNALTLYGRYVGVSLRAQMQYRTSFLIQTLGIVLTTGIEFLGIWALFVKFNGLRGWKLEQVAVIYAVAHLGFAVAETFGRGFDMFYTQVKSGDFDRLLLRPRSTALQVMGSEFHLMRMGRAIQALCILGWAFYALHLSWNPLQLLTLLLAVLGGGCVFLGLFILQATLSFWTVEGLELANIFTHGGTEAGQYPFSIYKPWFQRLFTFVVPLACVNYLPMSELLHHSEISPALGLALPLVGLLFLLISLLFWRLGVRHYHSTGS